MTDLEICQKIAEIEGVHWMPAYPNQPNEFVGLISENDFCGTPPELIGKFNPLTDKALCFDLMVKHEIGIDYVTLARRCQAFYGTDISQNFIDKNPQRAICLAIIAKHEGLNND